MIARPWFVYIMSNNAHTMYVGATNDLPSRVREHRAGTYASSFTARYVFDRCVFYEHCGTKETAIKRERQIKRWSRGKKIALIEAKNPWWNDLSVRFSLDAVLR